MIKYLQKPKEKTKLIILQNLMEALSMKAMLTTLRMKGLRWVDGKISNTLTKCWCGFLTMNFSLPIAVMLFCTVQPYAQFVFEILWLDISLLFSCSLSLFLFWVMLLLCKWLLSSSLLNQLSYQTNCERYAHIMHFKLTRYFFKWNKRIV